MASAHNILAVSRGFSSKGAASVVKEVEAPNSEAMDVGPLEADSGSEVEIKVDDADGTIRGATGPNRAV
ncbi:hypothetical protein VKT23_012050 [Stygiomarasmius scandens]|uniref:Uncharacterized protein n=1 Tax=Marasmiellus scandens TaxID=2682957 RepID=A0ABR1J9F1_9AGAR